jgi:hypothetical protein
VAALQLARVLVGRDVRVDVSVLLGRLHEQEVAVTTCSSTRRPRHARLSEAQTIMRLTKRAALQDLRRFERDRSVPHDAGAVRDWRQRTIACDETWISRLSPL